MDASGWPIVAQKPFEVCLFKVDGDGEVLWCQRLTSESNLAPLASNMVLVVDQKDEGRRGEDSN